MARQWPRVAVVAAITRGSVESRGIAEGQEVTVVIKATEVMLAR